VADDARRAAGPRIRPAAAKDATVIRRLVAEVVAETYGHLFAGVIAEPDIDWRRSLVAEIDELIVGVISWRDHWIDDLWIARLHRRKGIGRSLLAIAESGMRAHGHEEARLRVVAANAEARLFYRAQGWSETTPYTHEAWGFEMIDMIKAWPGRDSE
jgi:GNAT superfamily N-acetyltransferase